jgi:chromate transporter
MAVNALFTAATGREIVAVFLGSGVLVVIVRHAIRTWPRVAAGLVLPQGLVVAVPGAADAVSLAGLFAYFAKAGAFVFGSGLAIVPFLHGGVVQDMRWLSEREFVDAVAVSMITPGPVVITVAFIGYLVAGPAGATVAAHGVFLPAYGFVVVCARWFRRAVGDERVRAAVDGVTAAAAGAIAGAAYVLGRRAIIDAETLLLFGLTMAVLVWARRVPEPALILAAAAAGLGLRGFQP